MTRMRHGWRMLVAALAALLVSAPAAAACSTSDTEYFDGFLDSACLVTPLASQVELDVLGGLRLKTNGAQTTLPVWDTDTDFDDGVTYTAPEPDENYPPIDLKTLATQGAGSLAVLELPASALALVRDVTPESQLLPTPSAAPDGEHVDDPAVVKVGATYVMFFTGFAEDGSAPAIFRAHSPDGEVWTKIDADTSDPDMDPVLTGTAGAFDARGVRGAEVIYSPSSTPKYRMWYSGQGDTFGGIGYATSTDGRNWDKHDADDTATPDPDDTDPPELVLDHGRAGSRDSFAAAHPTVLKDGETWKMWYEGDDSNQKSILFATSTDGIEWSKGGAVIEPSPGGTIDFGAFAPHVRKTSTGFHMLMGGQYDAGGELKTRLVESTSGDGVDWTAPDPALNPQPNATAFDSADLNSPEILEDSGSPAYRLYYSGTSLSAVGVAHTKIGLSERQSPNGWNGGRLADAVLDVGASGATFDSREASGVAVASSDAGANYVGFYTGRKSDLVPRLGQATWDGEATGEWTKVAGDESDGSLLPLSNNGFDDSGQSDPSPMYRQNGDGTNDWLLWFTGHDGATTSIGYAATTETGAGLLPDQTAWSKTATARLAADATGFDATGVSAPSVVHDGTNYLMFYTGSNGSTTEIGLATSATPSGAFTSTGTPVITRSTTAGDFDFGGVKDPVVVRDTNVVTTVEWHMTYTAVEVRDDGSRVERMAYATSDTLNGTVWAEQGLIQNPSQDPFAIDEESVRPQGAFIDTTAGTLHVWFDGVGRDGRARGGHSSVPTAAFSGSLENGWATYQLGDVDSGPRDWRAIRPSFTGNDVELWVSFLQPYSTGSSKHWSDFFPVSTVTDTDADLDFLLTVEGVRWQARLADSDGTGDPQLDEVQIKHAPVSFFAGGSPNGVAETLAIEPPSGQNVTNWRELVLNWEQFQPLGGGTGGGSVAVLDGSGNPIPGYSAAFAAPGDVTIDLAGLSVATYPALKVRITLTSDGTATPVVNSLTVSYFTNVSQPPPPPPPPPPADSDGDGVPDASDRCPTVAAATADGCPPPFDVTLTANPALVVFGQTTTLAGKVTQVGAPLANVAVSLFEQPFGTPAFAAIAGATTNATGDYTSVVTPQSNTTYKASVPTGSSEPTAAVQVAQKILFRARRTGTKGFFSGAVQPAHPAKEVVIQRKSGTGFVAFKKVKTTSSSPTTFATTAKLKACQKYTFRVVSAADADHAEGTSPNVLVEKHRVALKVSVRGRKVTFTGKVAPLHRSGSVLIKRIVGTKASKFATAKLTRKSTFRLVKTVRKGRYVFRADKASDRCHFAGQSARRSARVR